MPPPVSKKGVYISKSGSDPDPWCLVCGVKLRLDGRSFVVLTSDTAEETRKLFVKVLGTQFKKDYASVNLCSKCERALKRINRYSGLDSAQKEADVLKKSLAENLKYKGQETVTATEADQFEVNNYKGSEPRSHKSDPLIDEDTEDWRDNGELIPEDDADDADNENVDTDKMPFGLFKKSKKDKKEKKDKKKDKEDDKTEMVASQEKEDEKQPVAPQPEPEPEAKPQQFKQGTTLAAMAKTVQKKPEPVRQNSYDASDGGYVPGPDKQSAVQEKSDPEKPVDKEETDVKKLEVKDGVVKSENSPLILKNGETKESKLQDQQPGMLCCTIL